MTRFRALATLFACLAILASTLNFAAAVQAASVAPHGDAVSAPCSDCDDCDKRPCPMPMADCIQMHVNAGPALLAGAVALPAILFVTVQWSPAHRALSGLSPSPDPSPPRA
jgi:hypothetical protein